MATLFSRLSRLTLCGLALAACGLPSENLPGDTRQAVAPLIGGTPSGPEENHSVWIQEKNISFSTGLLVAPNLVMTAIHEIYTYNTDVATICKDNGPGAEIFSPKPIENLGVFVGQKIPLPKDEPSARVSKVLALPVSNLCEGDIAFLVLDRDLDAPLAPLVLDTPPEVGEKGFVIGFGVFDVDGSNTNIRRRKDGISVLAVGPTDYQKPNGNAVYSLRPQQFMIDHGPCYGDSGAGYFDEATGGVMGVLSFLDNDNPTQDSTSEMPAMTCGSDAVIVATRLDSFKDFIVNVFRQEAHHAPLRAGKPAPAAFGATCTEDLDCDSLLCVSGLCSRSCASEACPEDFDCLDRSTDKVCSPKQPTAGSGGQTQQSAALPQGAVCTEASQCQSGLCVATDTQKLCSSRCDKGSCEGGWECLASENICLPSTRVTSDSGGCSLSAAPLNGGLGLFLGLWLLRRRRR